MTDVMARGLRVVPTESRPAGTEPPTAITFYACQVGERAYEDPKLQHGVFTYFILNGIRDIANRPDGRVEAGYLAAYLRENVAKWSQDFQQRAKVRGRANAYDGSHRSSRPDGDRKSSRARERCVAAEQRDCYIDCFTAGSDIEPRRSGIRRGAFAKRDVAGPVHSARADAGLSTCRREDHSSAGRSTGNHYHFEAVGY